MKVRSYTTFLLALALLAAPLATARNVILLPRASSGQPLVLYDESLGVIANVASPPNPFRVFSNPQGTKYFVVARSATNSVTVIDYPPGSTAPRNLGFGSEPQAAVLSPSGNRLYVAGNGIRAVDLQSEGEFTISGTGGTNFIDLAISLDSRTIYAVAANSNIITVIDTVANSAIATIPVSGNPTGVTVAPNGSFWVATINQVIEYDSQTNQIRGNIPVNALVGKLYIAPGGQFGLAANRSLNASSIILFDLNARSVLGTAAVSITSGVLNTVDYFIFAGSQRAFAYSAQVERLFDITWSPLTVNIAAFSGATAGSVLGAVATVEVPGPRSLYFSTPGTLNRVDLSTNAVIQSVASQEGSLAHAGPAPTGVPSSILTFNNNQTVASGGNTRQLIARVLDRDGRPLAGQSISVTATSPAIQLSTTTTSTSLDGYAVATAIMPQATGNYTINMTTQNGVVATFIITVTGGGGGGGTPTLAGIYAISGEGQLTLLNFPTPADLVVEVRDTNGTPLPGQTVTWVGSTGVFPLSASATTDANGRAATKVIISADVALGRAFVGGTVTATANNASVQFNVTGLPIGVNVFPSLVKPSADDRRITAKTGSVVAEAIRVVLLTGGGAGTTFGQPIPNVGLRATTGNTDPQLGPVASCQGGTVLTGANDGAAVCNLSVSGRAGRALLSVDLGGQFGYELELIVTPGDPTTPKIVSGNNQTGNPGQSLPLALVAQITDAAGTPLPNVAASWSVVTPGSGELTGTISTSDGSGRVSTLLRLGTLGGQHTVRVSVGNLSAFFTFTVNVVIGGITKVSGDNQTGVVAGSPFPAPLVVRVTDAQNRPAANITVTWALTGGSAVLSASTSPTDANGQASLNVTAGLTPGSISISASVPNLAPVVFNLASRAPGPALSSSGFVNYATGENYLTPGALAIIRGAGIATNVTGVLNASLLTGQLPTTLNSVTVLFGPEATAVAAPIYQIGNTGGVEYLLVQVPFEVSVPLTQAIIRVGTGSTTISNIPVRAFGPGVLEQTEATTNRRYALAIRPDGTTVTPANPARRGERIRIYAIGLGQTSPATGTNRLGAPGQTVVAPVVVGVNNAGVPVISATLAQNLVGIYEIVFEIPLDTAVGSFRPLGFFVETGGGTVQYANGSSIHIQ